MAIITCPKCGTKNRVDENTAAQKQPVCGRCGTKLTIFGDAQVTDTHPIEATDTTFESILSNAGDKPVLIDCWATWCPPCKMLAPIIEALAREAGGRWLIAKLDTDANPQTAGRFNITSIPTMLIFKKGKLIDQLVGLQSKPNIESRLQRAV